MKYPTAAPILSLCKSAIWHLPVCPFNILHWNTICDDSGFILFPPTIKYPADLIAPSLIVYEGVKVSDNE